AVLHVDLLLGHPCALDVPERLAALLNSHLHGIVEALRRRRRHLDDLCDRHRLPPSAKDAQSPEPIAVAAPVAARLCSAPWRSSPPSSGATRSPTGSSIGSGSGRGCRRGSAHASCGASRRSISRRRRTTPRGSQSPTWSGPASTS